MNKTRRKLNIEQIEVLSLLHKFRFSTNDLFAQYFGKKDRSFAFNRLKVLLEQGLIDKRFDSSYRLAGKPAAYYLAPTGARKLKEQGEEINIKAIYKDKTVSQQFIRHSLDVFETYLELRKKHPEIKFFTKTNLNTEAYDYFPKPLPDGFISIKSNGTTKRYFLDIFDETALAFVIKRRIKLYADYWESDIWDDTGEDFPEIIFICANLKQQERIQNLLEKTLDDEIAARALLASQLAEGLF